MSARLLVGAAAFVIAFAGARERAAFADEPTNAPAAAPAPAPVAAEQAPDAGARPQPWRVFPAFTVSGGATTLRLLDLPFTGGQALAGVSVEASKDLSLLMDLQYTRAATPDGLLMQLGRHDLTGTFVFGRVRFGLGAHVLYMAITRETRRDDSITKLGAGLHAQLSLDVVRLGEHGGLFLSIKPSVATLASETLLAGDFALGARF